MSGTHGVDLHRLLMRQRLRECPCPGCGRSLEAGTILSVGGGTTLDDYGLSDLAAARLLAATEVIAIQCASCGTQVEVGEALAQGAEARHLSADDVTPWNAHAQAIYRAIIQLRLDDGVCVGCGATLEAADPAAASGGTTLPEFDLHDEAAVALLGWTQRLTVVCPACRCVNGV